MKPTLTTPPALQRLMQQWRALPIARQRLIAGLGLIVTAVLFWAYALTPLQASRISNHQRITQLQAEYAEMQNNVAQLNQLKSLPPVAATANRTLASTTSLESIFGAASRVAAEPGGKFIVTSTTSGYAEWLSRVDMALSRHALTMGDINIERNADGRMRITVTLIAQPAGAAR
jgi:type II secretory pathway component PulM